MFSHKIGHVITAIWQSLYKCRDVPAVFPLAFVLSPRTSAQDGNSRARNDAPTICFFLQRGFSLAFHPASLPSLPL